MIEPDAMTSHTEPTGASGSDISDNPLFECLKLPEYERLIKKCNGGRHRDNYSSLIGFLETLLDRKDPPYTRTSVENDIKRARMLEGLQAKLVDGTYVIPLGDGNNAKTVYQAYKILNSGAEPRAVTPSEPYKLPPTNGNGNGHSGNGNGNGHKNGNGTH